MICRTLCSVRELRACLDGKRAQGSRVAVVPTMGALHEGHLSLVREAKRLADEVVVTIFVNPTQFGPGEDFERYPRDLKRDTELASGAGATVIFAPEADEMYPAGEQTRVTVDKLSQGMCGVSRPHHFMGVATIVAKLFNAAGPGVYLFGQKDYQQWRIIERMAKDLLFPVEVMGRPTVREADGLAMSSRNAYLTPELRLRAGLIPRALQAALVAFRDGQRDAAVLCGLVEGIMSPGLDIDYVEARDPVTLEPIVGPFEPPLLLGVAARLGAARPGAVRLIDNVVLALDADNIIAQGQA